MKYSDSQADFEEYTYLSGN